MTPRPPSPSTLRRDRIVAAAVTALALGLAATGAPRLVSDGDASYRLPGDHPLHRLNERWVEATGGDDVVAVLLHDPGGLVDPTGVAAVDAARTALEASGALTGVRDFTTLSLPAVKDGVVTGEAPLDPRPKADDAPGWEAARARLVSDPFARGLLSEDATTALVVGWIRREAAPGLFIDRVNRDLASAEFRETPTGKALRGLIDATRLSVMMGEREGPPDAAVGEALEAAATGSGPESEYLLEARRDAAVQASDPDAAARAAVVTALTGAPEDGVERLPVGSGFVREAMLLAYPGHVQLGFVGLFAALFVLVARRRESFAAGAVAVFGGGVAIGGAVGVLGWFGVPLHPISAQFLLGLALLATLGLLVAGRSRQPRLELLLLVLLPWCSRDLHGVSGLGLSAALAVAWAAVFVWGRALEPRPPESASLDPELLGLTRRPGTGAVAIAGLLVAMGTFAAAAQPLGIRPSRWLPEDDPVGAAMRLMDAELGGAAPLHVVATSGEGGMAEPERLASLRAAGDALAEDPAVDSVVGWPDFLSMIHAAVSGAAQGALPGDPDLVQQYLLLFDRPDETRPLVARDRSLGVSFVRLAPGMDGAVGRLVERLPAGNGGPALAGEGAALALGGRVAARSVALLLGMGMVVALGALLWVPVPGARRAPEFEERLAAAAGAVYAAVPSGCIAAGAAAWVGAALGAEALLAGAAVAGTSLAVSRCDERDRLQAFVLLGVGLGVLALGPIAPLRGLGIGVFAGSVAALGLGRGAG